MAHKVKLRNIQVGCQKARLVADMIRGKGVNDALRILTFAQPKSALLFKKLLESGLANARQKGTADVDNLFVSEVWVDMGPSLTRYRPRAQGRAFPVRKKSSHFNLVLDER